MTYPCWKMVQNRITLVTSEKIESSPTAAEVFNQAFNDNPDISQRIRQDLHPLELSRFAPELAVRIGGSPPSNMTFETGLIVNGRFHTAEWQYDQCIIDNCWYPIDTNSVDEANEWLVNRKLNAKAPPTIGQLIALNSAFDLPFQHIDATSNFTESSQSTDYFSQIKNLEAIPYSYQMTGINFLSAIATQEVGCILGDEMGLGKTLQIIGLILFLKQRNKNHFLVIAPATLLENWRREIAQFSPSVQTKIHSGPQRSGIPNDFKSADVIIVSYETLIRDELLLAHINWDLVVLDEAQNIKNPGATRTLAVKRLPRTVSIAVTGTPVENRLEDLWSVADFVLPRLLGTLKDFKAKFENNVDDAAAVSSIVKPILLRRRVADVATDLPARIEIPQAIELSQNLADDYEYIRLQALASYGASAGLVATTYLRLFCAHPSLALIQDKYEIEDLPKFVRLLEILEEIFDHGEKVLVFTTYQDMTNMFMDEARKRWSSHFFDYIDGRVPVHLRQPIVDSFFEHQGAGALFLNPKAAGTGLNITAANHVVHFNPEWNPALTDQATARAHRRKQTRPVTVHSLYYIDTIEQVILERAMFKRTLADHAVTGHDGEVDVSLVEKALARSPINQKSSF
jgi:SNF2 family DNA or RNA helicase